MADVTGAHHVGRSRGPGDGTGARGPLVGGGRGRAAGDRCGDRAQALTDARRAGDGRTRDGGGGG